ncbi:MAG: hypothetical protein ABIH21_04635 [Patescibacteria group bacterium]
MMTRKSKTILILILLAAIIILTIAILFKFLSKSEKVGGTDVLQDQVENQAPFENILFDANITGAEVDQQNKSNELGIQALAKTFVERYGSFSFESEFENLRDVMPLMTDSYAADMANKIKSMTASEVFYSISTRVITTDVEELDEQEGVAKVIVTTQREEAAGSPQDRKVRYQPIVLTFKKISGIWKVASAIWEE